MLGKLLLLFILVPLIELYLFIKLDGIIGTAETIAIIIITGILGAWLAKAQGSRALLRLKQASAEGRLPHLEVIDGLIVLIAGAVLITPGFLTDTIGFLLLIPAVRSLLHGKLGAYLKSKITVISPVAPNQEPPMPRRDDPDVIDV